MTRSTTQRIDRPQVSFRLTGNPFVDAGLYVLSYLAKVNSPEELSMAKLDKIHGDGTDLAHINARLRSFTMVFGTNGPLTQSGYRPIGKKKTLSKKNIAAYTNVLSGFLQEIGRNDSRYPICEICGI